MSGLGQVEMSGSRYDWLRADPDRICALSHPLDWHHRHERLGQSCTEYRSCAVRRRTLPLPKTQSNSYRRLITALQGGAGGPYFSRET